MRYSVSDTAEYGDYTRGPRIVNDADARRDEEDPRRNPVRRIRASSGSTKTRPAARSSWRCAKPQRNQPIEMVGRELREMMTFLKKKKEAAYRRTAVAAAAETAVRIAVAQRISSTL